MLPALIFSAFATQTSNSPTFVELPYVQLGHNYDGRSLELVWQTSSKTGNFSYKYAQPGGLQARGSTNLATQMIELPSVSRHYLWKVKLRNLIPGEPVSYEISLDNKRAFASTVMAPKSANQPYRMVVFGDCGVGTNEQKKIAYQAGLQKPDQVIITGDIVYNTGRISEYRQRFFPVYNPTNASPETGSPLLSRSLVVGAAGNHDLANGDLNVQPDRYAYYYYWSQPLNGPSFQFNKSGVPSIIGSRDALRGMMDSAGPRFLKSQNFSYDYGNTHFLVLDSNPYVNWSEPRLRSWVKADLASSKARWKVVVYHHPGFHSSPTHQAQKQMRVLADVFEDEGVDIVLNGHVHNYQRTFPIQAEGKRGVSQEELEKDNWRVDRSFDGGKNTRPNGVIYLVDGGGGAGIYNREIEDQPEKWNPFQAKYIARHTFSVIDVNANTFALKQIDLEGKQVDEFKITK